MAFSANSDILATGIFRKRLQQIPTIFGRLVYLSSLRNEATGRYSDPDLVDSVGFDTADRMLRDSHFRVFSQWIASSLEEQKQEIEEYLRTVDDQQVVRNCRNLLPPGAREVERQLYLTDFETLLTLIRFERGAAPAAPEASPPR